MSFPGLFMCHGVVTQSFPPTHPHPTRVSLISHVVRTAVGLSLAVCRARFDLCGELGGISGGV